ncbi:MAG: response regulator transcription factor [Chloroflexi bacterium]|nr:response regulator transcription factor [Chloroflexota bacterium]
MIKMLVADDHAVVRKGLKEIVGNIPQLVVADEACNGDEVMRKVWQNDYDLLLLDITMPGRSGLEVLKEVKNLKPQLPILILSIHPEEHYAVRVLRAGASGYLNKESAPDELRSAIEKVAAGGKYVSPIVAEILASELVDSEKAAHESLSDREYEIMCMVATGKTVKQAATELKLSPKTVSSYIHRILVKMRMRNKSQLTRYAIEHLLI